MSLKYEPASEPLLLQEAPHAQGAALRLRQSLTLLILDAKPQTVDREQ